jgi:hypothetical protein
VSKFCRKNILDRHSIKDHLEKGVELWEEPKELENLKVVKLKNKVSGFDQGQLKN